MFQKFLALFTFLGITQATVKQSADGVFLSEEELEKAQSLHTQVAALTKDLEAATTAKTAAEAAKATADAALVAANEKASGLQTKVDELTTANTTQAERISELEAKIAGKPHNKAETKRSGDEGGGVTQEEADNETVMNMPHNKAAMQKLQ